MEEVKIRFSAFQAKVDALIRALDEHQKATYTAELKRIKESYLRNHPELNEEHQQLVDKFFQ